MAGMQPLRFVAAPLAAAVGALWSSDKSSSSSSSTSSSTIVAVNVGSSSADVQVIAVSGSSSSSSSDSSTVYEVESTSGDSHSGGADMDHLLARALQVSVTQRVTILYNDSALSSLQLFR
jgi:molecular chaperone DnaK (HSP70)